MATPLSADQFVNALREEGVRVETVRNWRTHNRGTRGDGWGPINGVIIHHTVSRGTDSSVDLCYDGYAELPGPLCHGVIAKDGTVYIISVGRSNHAGGGDPNVLAAVRDERYSDYPPVTQRGNSNGVDGNAHFYGYECINMGDGKDPWPPEQVDAIVRASAAICRAYGWTSKSVIAHREWSRDKSDPTGPGMPAMPQLRAKIAERLAHPATWNPTPPTTPTTGTPDVASPNLTVLLRSEDLTLTKDTAKDIYWTAENTDEPNGHGAGGKSVLNGGRYTATLNLRLEGLGENEVVELRPTDDTFVGSPHEIEGRGNPALPVQVSVTLNGRVNGLLAFQLISRTGATVTLTDATLSMLSWPNP